MADNNRFGGYGGDEGRFGGRGDERRGRDERGAGRSPDFNQGFGSGYGGGRHGEGGYGARSDRDPYAARDEGGRGFRARGPVDDRFDQVSRTRQEAFYDERRGDRMERGENRGGREERRYEQRGRHSASGLEVFDRSLQTTHVWLKEIIDDIGPDKQVAWHVLTAVLRTIRDRVPVELAAHLGAQLPLLVRGAYYDQFRVNWAPERTRHLDDFLQSVVEHMRGIGRPVNPRDAFRAVARTMSRHVSEGQVRKIVDSLPAEVQQAWMSACRDVEMVR